MTRFDTFIMVDWSASSTPSPAQPSANAIWIAHDTQVSYHRTRAGAESALMDVLREQIALNRRVLLGFDFAFGYPMGFASKLCDTTQTEAVWAWLDSHIRDNKDNTNNRFEVADGINARFQGIGPFWGRSKARTNLPHLPWGTKNRGGFDLPERRVVEQAVTGASSVWQLLGNGAVGSQTLMGAGLLHRLGQAFGASLAVWPFQPMLDAQVVVSEIYPSLIDEVVRAEQGIRDAAQVRLMAATLREMQERGTLQEAFELGTRHQEEGWILGAGVKGQMKAAARAAANPNLQPPRLSNDCFALPPGVDWEPVDAALERLSSVMHPIKAPMKVDIFQSLNRISSHDIQANRANPPAPNTAVDGYGFAASSASGPGRHVLKLVDGISAAGAPYRGEVRKDCAIRILTGALLPKGVDTVVLQEDTTAKADKIAFEGPVKAGANTRKAGEDVQPGRVVLEAGQRIRPPDIALLAATGHEKIVVFENLKVGVLSTGDELRAPLQATSAHHTVDANRPMLLSLIEAWGHQPVDLGHVKDERKLLKNILNDATEQVDVVLTSGGASAGDEDHVSALLRAEGSMTAWRIALKPGRPLALAMWKKMPVFGLPGNPVAALVCALIFARPALSRLAGGNWLIPQGFMVPAAFTKTKKPGRREFLRARMNAQGTVEVFPSEGSGRISGLSWATGLVELPDGAAQIEPGTPVRYLPYASFGL